MQRAVAKKPSRRTSQTKNKEQLMFNIFNSDDPVCRFSKSEVETLLRMFDALVCKKDGKMDKSTFHDVLSKHFHFTDDMIMDRIFKAFDKDNDGYLKKEEWVLGLSVFLRGDTCELARCSFRIYDLNGDGMISREEMFQLLKNCVTKQNSEEDPDENVKELIELIYKILDKNHDNKLDFNDFHESCVCDSLLMECLGKWLPDEVYKSKFLGLL